MRILLTVMLAPILVTGVRSASAGDPASLFTALDINSDGRLIAEEIPAEKHWLFDRLVRLADGDGDNALSTGEFTAGLKPAAPTKPLEEPRRYGPPNADAVRWLLLSLDVNRDRRLTASEAPEALRPAFDELVDELDNDDNRALSLAELNRGGRNLAQVARRAARRSGVEVAAELRRLREEQGGAADRFDRPPEPSDFASLPIDRIVDNLLQRFDGNGDARIDRGEAEGRLAERFDRVDRNGDGRLSKRELTAAARFLKRRFGGAP